MNGVYFNKQKQLWHARTTINGKRHHVGYFHSEISGLRAIDDYKYDLEHPDTGIMRNNKLELEDTYTGDERENFSIKRWFKRELKRIGIK